MSATGTAEPQAQHQGLTVLKASLGNLRAAVSQQKYQLRKDIISPQEFVISISKSLLNYVNFVQNELPREVEGMFYAPEVSLTGLIDTAEEHWHSIKELHNTGVLSDREAGIKLISVINSIMSVLERKTTEFKLA